MLACYKLNILIRINEVNVDKECSEKGQCSKYGAILKKKICNPIPYKIYGKLPKFHANWIINKKVIKRKPTGGGEHCAPPPIPPPSRNRVK